MYFQELEDLKTKYNLPEDIINKLDIWFAYLRKTQRKYILPDYFAREYSLSHQRVRELFYHATLVGVLEINYEIHCPYCDYKLDIEVHKTQDIPNEKVACDECGKEFNPALFYEKIIISYNLLKNPVMGDKKKLELL